MSAKASLKNIMEKSPSPSHKDKTSTVIFHRYLSDSNRTEAFKASGTCLHFEDVVNDEEDFVVVGTPKNKKQLVKMEELNKYMTRITDAEMLDEAKREG